MSWEKESSPWYPGADLILFGRPGHSSIKYTNFTEHQHRGHTVTIKGPDKHKTKSTVWSDLSRDKTWTMSKPQNTKYVPILTKICDCCIFTSYRFSFGLVSDTSREGLSRYPNLRVIPSSWQHPIQNRPCFLKPSPKSLKLHNQSFPISYYWDTPQFSIHFIP